MKSFWYPEFTCSPNFEKFWKLSNLKLMTVLSMFWDLAFSLRKLIPFGTQNSHVLRFLEQISKLVNLKLMTIFHVLKSRFSLVYIEPFRYSEFTGSPILKKKQKIPTCHLTAFLAPGGRSTPCGNRIRSFCGLLSLTPLEPQKLTLLLGNN